MKSLNDCRTNSSQLQSSRVECRREETEKIHRTIQNCKAKGTSTYIYVDGKIYLVTAQGVILSYEGTATVAYSQSKQYREMPDSAAISAIHLSDKESSLLVIGYGNSNHDHDAIVRRVTKQLQTLGFENVEFCAVEQLQPELSTKLSRADYAIFVHAGWMKMAEVKIEALDVCGLETAGSSTPGCGHSCSPCSLLALSHSAYGHQPQSWLVKVPDQYLETGHHLSGVTQQSIQKAVDKIEVLIHQGIYKANFQETMV